jgi:hypothetical protein
MEERDKEIFSWDLLFIVTGVSFLIFSGFLKLIGGERTRLFFYIGIAILGIGLLLLLRQLFLRTKGR